jgi:NAD(P)-dependent dehydrogenase (short-subunit alcohol dehydrogenase family)
MARVQDKIALITGASGGIGSETARVLAREGAVVILTDIRDEAGQAIAGEIGARAHYLHLDVANEAHWQSASDVIRQRFGGLDILFNCAGVSGFESEFDNRPQDVEHMCLDDWRQIHAVNLDGVFLGCKYGIALMRGRGGSIINMSSRSGMVGIAETAAYCSSKGAVRNLTKSVAMHCAQSGLGIRCNSLHPGAILTPIWDRFLGDTPEQREAMLAYIRRGIPLNEMGRPIDVAYSVLYLASDESRYLTGSELVIDGGIMAGTTAAPSRNDGED